MPGGSGKPKRACAMCKHYKYLGNAKGRRTAKEEATREAMSREAAAHR